MSSKLLENRAPRVARRLVLFAGLLLLARPGQRAPASENVPHRPFAQWADVPEHGQFVVGALYEESEAYHIWTGSFRKDFAFAPGTRSAAIEPELLLRKHFGWPGLGVYADGLFRWNRTSANDQYLTVIGLFQQFKGWELDVGYRYLHTITGSEIVLNPDQSIQYPRDVREINHSIEAGFSYTTP